MFDISYSFPLPLGNEEIKKLLRNELENCKLNHALLLEGPIGSGRKTFARNIASALACKASCRPCGNCRYCKRIIDNKCPDVINIVVPNEKKTISVDQIREIRLDAFVIPCELDFKMYIISEADKMTIAAQNAFLKILEEPPEYVYFILICESSATLLPTIKSRTQNLKMECFSQEILSDLAISKIPSAKKLLEYNDNAYYAALKRSMGSFGMLEKNIADALKKNKSDEDNLSYLILHSLVASTKDEYILQMSSIPSEREEYRAFLDSVIYILRDLIAIKSVGNASLSLSDSSAQKLSDLFSEKQLYSLFDFVYNIRAENESNTNINLSSANLLFSLWEIIRGV